jgi:hypothetical protein
MPEDQQWFSGSFYLAPISNVKERQFMHGRSDNKDFFPVYAIPDVRTFTEDELRACRSLGDAYDTTMRLSGLARKQIAAQSNIPIEVLSMMSSGKRNVPAEKMLRFYEVCQNLYALQWQAFQFGKVFGQPLTGDQKAALYDYQQSQQRRSA